MITMIARYFRASCTMVGMVIKGADSAIYGEDMCAAVQYVYCTLVHITLVEYSTPLTKLQYLRYIRLPVLLRCGQQSEV